MWKLLKGKLASGKDLGVDVVDICLLAFSFS